ncbi:hypothetical protein PanWU01x14_271240, partial [Parasponia andersonii]
GVGATGHETDRRSFSLFYYSEKFKLTCRHVDVDLLKDTCKDITGSSSNVSAICALLTV